MDDGKVVKKIEELINRRDRRRPTMDDLSRASKARKIVEDALEAAGYDVDGGSLFTDVIGGEVTFQHNGELYEVTIQNHGVLEG